MDLISIITSNTCVNAAFVSWATAQILKTFINFFQTKKLHAKRLYGAGGMPSAHSAAVVALTLSIFRRYGFDSPYFAICLVFGAIVMYDAMTVRYQAGKHAKVINEIELLDLDYMYRSIRELMGMETPTEPTEEGDSDSGEKLEEYIGHTPLEVFCGAALGAVIAILMPV